MKSSVTVSLVPEVRGGPFVFWDGLATACRLASAFGFDGIEIFAPSAEEVDEGELRAILSQTGLRLAAMGTGAGWVKHRLSLTSSDPKVRDKAKAFIRAVIDRAGPFGAPAIIGSMQGRSSEGSDRPTAMELLADALNELGEHARQYNVPLLFEPLNRYETDLVVTMAAGVKFLNSLASKNVKLLADLFHMNIEEGDLPDAVRDTGAFIGHVHFVDSNRQPAGMGHTEFLPIMAALRDIGYSGYLSAEALPYPDPDSAARKTIETIRKYV